MEEDRVLRFDVSTISRTREGPSGGLIVTGNLRRTGVLEYRMPDGSTRRELVHPDEAFHPDARESFKGAPITEDHPGKVDPQNWAQHARGHVDGTPVANGRFLEGDFHIQDAKTIAKVRSKQLQEISTGYTCAIDPTPGEWNGQKFDCIQRDPRGNHVALGPPGWGRAGPEVRLHMDGAGVSDAVTEEVAAAEEPTFADKMTKEQQDAFDKAQADIKAKDEELAKLRADSAKAKTDAEKATADAKELETLRAKNSLLEAQAARVDSVKSEQENQARQDARINELVGLRDAARRVFATQKDPTGAQWKADGKQPDDIRREILAVIEPNFKLIKQDGSALDGDALDAVYRQAIEHATRVDGARAFVQQVATAPRVDGRKTDEDDDDDDDDMDKADANKCRKDVIKDSKSRFVPASMRDRKDKKMMDGKGAR